MSVRTRVAVAAAALVAAAATLLIGYGDGHPEAKGGGKPASVTRTPGEMAKGGDTDERGDGPSKPASTAPPAGPKVPGSDSTTAIGTFTKREKSYLAHRVPKGTDPAAILDIGQEICERIARTAKHDRDAAISALRSGEIEGAKAAITHLCPEHLPLLEAAEKGSSS